jgi:hypothetical protein
MHQSLIFASSPQAGTENLMRFYIIISCRLRCVGLGVNAWSAASFLLQRTNNQMPAIKSNTLEIIYLQIIIPPIR